MSPARLLRCVAAWLLFTALAFPSVAAHAADPLDTIARVKRSVVVVGTYERTRSPAFEFRGTGFAVGNGSTIVTNAHVLPAVLDPTGGERLAVMLPANDKGVAEVREATRLNLDAGSDLALLKLSGDALQPLVIGDSTKVREGQEIYITGYPIGAVLGPIPATHHGMISAITPIAIAQARAGDLDPAVVRRLANGSYPVFQLDATAYPGNSGSPVYDASTGEVLGIVNMVFVKGTKESALSQPSGITYAVPASHLQELVRGTRTAAAQK